MPGRSELWRRNLYPHERAIILTKISGLVFLSRMSDIRLLRSVRVSVSISRAKLLREWYCIPQSTQALAAIRIVEKTTLLLFEVQDNNSLFHRLANFMPQIDVAESALHVFYPPALLDRF